MENKFSPFINETQEAFEYGNPIDIPENLPFELNKNTLEEYIATLKRHRYSNLTIKNYLSKFNNYLLYLKNNNINKVENSHIITYIDSLAQSGLSESVQNTAINAIKFWYEQANTPSQSLSIEVPRPRRVEPKPRVLKKEDIQKIINSTENIKHKCMICMTYSAGLRISETISMKISDIDYNNNLVHIKSISNKNKIRQTILSENMILLLKEYFSEYRPMHWLFEGQATGQPYSARGLQDVLKKAALRAGVGGEVTVHMLRHSFAVHLLEAGTDLGVIQELLGHYNRKTTEKYVYVTLKKNTHIKSPLDSLDI